MSVWAIVRSASAANHMRQALADQTSIVVTEDVNSVGFEDESGHHTVLVHADSYAPRLDEVLASISLRTQAAIGVASDQPTLTELLTLSRFGVRAYFNSYMADVHYVQMLGMLEAGQSWFPPGLLDRALAAARTAVLDDGDQDLLKVLTPRERQVAIDVAAGLSNKDIAERRQISDRTVKTHLTKIFRKLGVNGRLALAVLLRTGSAPSVEGAD